MLFKKNYFYFWLTAVLILATGFFIYPAGLKTTINFNDTYYVFVNRELTTFLTVLYLFFGFVYWLYEKLDYKLNRFLTMLHTILMVGGFIVYNALLWYTNYEKPLPNLQNMKNFSAGHDTNVDFIVLFMMLLAVQPFFIFNLILGGFKKK